MSKCSYNLATDARRGEVFHARYRRGADGRFVGDVPAVAPPSELAAALAEDPPERIIGDGATVHAEEFRRVGLVVGDGPTQPGPEAVLALAATATEPPVSEREIVPCYLRRPDAVAKWETAAGGTAP